MKHNNTMIWFFNLCNNKRGSNFSICFSFDYVKGRRKNIYYKTRYYYTYIIRAIIILEIRKRLMLRRKMFGMKLKYKINLKWLWCCESNPRLNQAKLNKRKYPLNVKKSSIVCHCSPNEKVVKLSATTSLQTLLKVVLVKCLWSIKALKNGIILMLLNPLTLWRLDCIKM